MSYLHVAHQRTAATWEEAERREDRMELLRRAPFRRKKVLTQVFADRGGATSERMIGAHPSLPFCFASDLAGPEPACVCHTLDYSSLGSGRSPVLLISGDNWNHAGADLSTPLVPPSGCRNAENAIIRV